VFEGFNMCFDVPFYFLTIQGIGENEHIT